MKFVEPRETRSDTFAIQIVLLTRATFSIKIRIRIRTVSGVHEAASFVETSNVSFLTRGVHFVLDARNISHCLDNTRPADVLRKYLSL